MSDTRITPNKDVGREWQGRNGKTYRFSHEEPPHLDISITSFEGSLVGMHSYARVCGRSPDVYCIEEDHHYMMAGFGPKKPTLHDYQYEARRTVTKVEYDMNREVLCPVGQSTERFNSAYDAFKQVLVVALEHFADEPDMHWEVRFQHCGEELDSGQWRLSDIEENREHLLELFGEWGDE